MSEWRHIDGYSRYEINHLGEVRSKRGSLKPSPNHNGYLRVNLFEDASGKRRWKRLHLLVLLTFVGAPPTPKHEGAHLNGDQKDCRLDNLAWATRVENESHKKVKRNGAPTKLADAQAAELVLAAGAGESFTKLAKVYGLHRGSVSRIVRGLRRRHLTASP